MNATGTKKATTNALETHLFACYNHRNKQFQKNLGFSEVTIQTEEKTSTFFLLKYFQMIIEPKVRGFICVTTHPEGCRENVRNEIKFFKKSLSSNNSNTLPNIKNVLVIGGSTGYGLSSRIAAAFCMKANTFNVSLERLPKPGRAASPGWYNTAELEKQAKDAGLHASSLFKDAFSKECKEETCQHIVESLPEKSTIDLLVYSVASPKREIDGTVYSSVLKPIGKTIKQKTVNWYSKKISTIEIPAASDEEVTDTVRVMGGEDWKAWVDALKNHDLLANNFTTLAYSYIGPKLTADVYRNGTIGAAKKHLEATAIEINNSLSSINAKAYVSVNKALVTQASAAIPIIPLYLSLLISVLKEKGREENCAMQINRLFNKNLFTSSGPKLDNLGRLRVDNYEMDEEVQKEVEKRWQIVNDDNLEKISEINEYGKNFLALFGFGVSNVDYQKEVTL